MSPGYPAEAAFTVPTGVSRIWGEIHHAAGAVSHAVHDARRPLELGGHTPQENNSALVLILTGVAFAALVGGAVDAWCPPLANLRSRPKAWLLLVVFASYLLLLPGLVEVLFSFTIAIEVLGFQYTLTKVDGSPAPISESTLSVVQELYRTGSASGACLVVLCAVVVPFVKLLLLLLGELWRGDHDPTNVEWARNCILSVQLISKWACPDMFAYILILYLLRSLGERVPLLRLLAQLEVGFICFSVFCLCSTASALAIELPPRAAKGATEPLDEDGDEEEDADEAATTGYQRLSDEIQPPAEGARQWCGPSNRVAWGVAVLCASFATLLTVGLGTPCMSLQLDKDFLLEPKGPLPSFAWPLIDDFRLMEQARADVSLWHCVRALASWCQQGEAVYALALVLVAGFALLLPALDMLALACAAAGAAAAGDRGGLGIWRRAPAIAARVLKHLAMLDVLVVGVLVTGLASRVYRAQGIVVEWRPGLALLGAAEAAHYATYHLVTSCGAFHGVAA